METIAQRIDRLCGERGVTGAQLCRDLGFSRSYLTELRKGRVSMPTVQKADSIAIYLGVTLDYLLSGNAPGTDDFTYALHNEAARLTEANQKKLLEMAKFFYEQQQKEKEN